MDDDDRVALRILAVEMLMALVLLALGFGLSALIVWLFLTN
jgi:hypothetical protein